MRVLTTQEAIKMVDDEVEVTMSELESDWCILLTGDNELLAGEALISFVTNYLQHTKQFTRDDDEYYKLNEAIGNRVLKGYSLNIILSQCKGVMIDN